jgi:phage terminase large subunit-like protein
MRETNSSLHSNTITAERFGALSSAARRQVIGELSERDANALLYDWEFWARPAQLAPPGDWVNWLILAGRGFGKTRVGAEQVRRWTKEFPIVNLIGPTAADVRDIMVQGSVLARRSWRYAPKTKPRSMRSRIAG